MQKDDKNRPLSGVFIGSFDLLTGIRLCHKKVFKELTDQQIEDIIKISLSNVHRQEQRSFENFSVSSIEIHCYKLLVKCAIFNISSSKNRYHYYSVGLIFDSNNIRKNEHLNEMLIFWTKVLANNVRNLLVQNNPKQDTSYVNYSSLGNLINRISDECLALAQSKIDILPSFELIKPFDENFYATALTSHIQTQMTTVIELPPFEDNEPFNFQNLQTSQKNKINTISKVKPPISRATSLNEQESNIPYQPFNHKFIDLLHFLSHFILPSQRELSSLNVKNYPTPGLFLQCVCSQKVTPEEYLSISPRPTTWIRLQDMKIFRTNEKFFLEQYRSAIQSNLYTTNENDSNNSSISPYFKPFWPISSKSKKDQINKMIILTMSLNNCSSWASSTVSMLQCSPKFARNMAAEQQMTSIIRLTFAFIAVKNESLELQNEDHECLSAKQISEIQNKEFDSLSNDDLLMITSLSQIFDENTYRQMQIFLSNVYK